MHWSTTAGSRLLPGSASVGFGGAVRGRRSSVLVVVRQRRLPRILDGPVLATYESDTQYSIGGYDSPYEEIGLELMALLDARNAARSGTPERASANRRLGEFLVGVGGSVHGRPTVLRRAAARKLAEEGFPLFRALWEAFATPIKLNPRVQRVLRGLAGGNVEPEEWALRLVLPTFSALEIQAMVRNIRATRGPRAAGMSPPRNSACTWSGTGSRRRSRTLRGR